MTTLTTPRPSRLWAALCTAGRCVTAHLATENGWFWSYGVSYPLVPPPYPPIRTSEGPRYFACGDDQQP